MGDERLHFVDRLRGLAVIVMIEVHVVNALLRPELRQGGLFRALDAFNGLVAPAFLFCAGISAALGARKLREGTRTRVSALKKALTRSAELLFWGTLLHASHLISAWKAVSPDARDLALRQFYQCDILQVFAFASLLAFIVSAVTDREDLYVALCVLLGIEFFFAAPFRDLVPTDRWPMALASYVNDEVPSQFPLAPWCGFFFFGAASTSALRRGTSGLAASVALLVVLFGLAIRMSDAFPPHDPHRTGPALMIVRLAMLLLVSAALNAFFTSRNSTSRAGTVVDLFAKESLFVYLVHIALVYGRHPASLREIIGPTRGPLACAALWILVTLAMYGATLLKERVAVRFKRRNREAADA